MKIYRYIFIFLQNLWVLQVLAINDTLPQSQLITDRNSYVSGDMAFLKIYNYSKKPYKVNEQTIYVDLVNQESEFIVGEIINLKNRRAVGYIEIPDTLQSGKYILRMYSDASKESDLPFLATKIIYVSNRFGKNEPLYQAADLNDKDTITSDTNEFETGCILTTNKEKFGKRKKVSVHIALPTQTDIDTAWASLSVIPVSKTGQKIEKLNCELLKKSKSVQNGTVDAVAPGIKLQGTLTNITGTLPISNAIIFLTLQDTVLRLEYDLTDTTGTFCFYLQNYSGTQTLFFNAFTQQNMKPLSGVQITLNDMFLKRPSTITPEKSIYGYRASSDTLNILKSIIAKAYQSNTFTFSAINTRNPNIYAHKYLTGELNDVVFPEHFVELNDFAEIAKEILPFIRYKKSENHYNFSIIDGQSHAIKYNPLVFVDGIPLIEADKILNYNTPKIKRIDAKAQTRIYGDLFLENGLIEIWTQEHNFWSLNESKFNTTFRLNLYQNPIQFKFPDYSKASDATLPDFRQTLYWNPDITLIHNQAQELSFYTSDESGLFEIILKGFTLKGETITARKLIIIE
jgi:hypothetical protein